MSDQESLCHRFEDWMLDGGRETEPTTWDQHLESCAACREQLATHRLLAATYSEESVPELSPAFQAGLDHKLEAAVRVGPLEGWRLAAMAGYMALAVAIMVWLLRRFPLPSLSIDPSSPWTIATAMLIVPLSLWLTMLATRLVPSQRSTGARPLAL